MMSCHERRAVREETLARLSCTDWQDDVVIVLDAATEERRQARQEVTAHRLLREIDPNALDFAVFLEDDLDFNLYLRHNLEGWAPMRSQATNGHFFGSLYNPNVRVLSESSWDACFVADPNWVYGSQAFVLSSDTVRHVVANWAQVPGMQDIKMSRLAAAVSPIYYHRPSLVQHMPVQSLWGGPYHWANDFDREWKATEKA